MILSNDEFMEILRDNLEAESDFDTMDDPEDDELVAEWGCDDEEQ